MGVENLEEIALVEEQLEFLNVPDKQLDLLCPNSPGGSSCASFVMASNYNEAEEIFQSLKQLTDEIHVTEMQLAKEEKSYES